MSPPRSILLVEDDRDAEALALRALKRSNPDDVVFVARDGVEALDFLFNTGSHARPEPTALPNIVFLDLNLPKLSGLDVLRRIRADQRTKLVPVVMLTSSSEEEDVTSCYQLGANSYVCKPVDFKRFSETVALLGRYWLGLNQVRPSPTTSDRP